MNNIYFSELDPERLDKRNGIVYGVAVCSEGPARGHGLTVTRTTLEQLYNAAQAKNDKIPVKLDHRSGIKEVCGFLTDFEIDGSKLRANWHLMKNQANFLHTWETIEKMHDVCGLSCSFTGEGENGKAVCRELISCDFVPHPATGTGLFSRGDVDDETDNESDEMTERDEPTIEELLEHIEQLTAHIEHVEAVNGELLDAVQSLLGEDEAEGDDDDQEAVISERGAGGGPETHDHRALLQSTDFESRIEELQITGLDFRTAHIEALKEFARSKYQTLNL